MLFSPTLLVATAVLVYAATSIYNASRRKPTPRAPAFARTEEWPMVGSPTFFSERWDFLKRTAARTASGTFSFWAGQHHIVAITGEEGRKTFMESRELDAGEGYKVLLGGQPNESTSSENLTADIFKKRLVKLLKGSALKDGLPLLSSDIRESFDTLARDPEQMMQPFESIYNLVYQLTMRTVACNEIANDKTLSARILSCFETIEKTGDNVLAIIYPSLWTPSRIRQMWAGFQIYSTLKKIVDQRAKSGKRENDALQFLIDSGDDMKAIIEFIVGALYAGLLNTGINAAWMVTFASRYPDWCARMRSEVESVAYRYSPNRDVPLKDRLMDIPIEAWETEFPVIDQCLKETIRLSLGGTAFRKNVSNVDVPIGKSGKDVIPPNSFAVCATADTHWNPDIFPNPSQWDPERYSEGRTEDKKEQYAWWGWGVARHPCLGMRFAKLENNLIIAFWLAYFDSEVCDANGSPTEELPPIDLNDHTAKKPAQRSYVKYRTRDD